jgi:hypothetical protein
MDPGLVILIKDFVVRSFQDWFQIKLKRNNDLKNRKGKLVEEVFMLLPAINEKVYDLNHILIQRIMDIEPTQSMYDYKKYSTSIVRIKYILKMELVAPDNVWKLFEDLENYVQISMYIISHELMSRAGLVSKTNQLNQIILNAVQDFGGDYKKAALAYSSLAKSEAEALIKAIEDFLVKISCIRQ